MKIKSFVLLIMLYACNNSVAAPGKSESPQDTVGKKYSLFDSKEGYLLTYKNDSLEQKMKVVRKSKEVMDFSLILINTRKQVSDTLNGKLTYVDAGGDETDEADDGSGFFYSNWNYTDKNGCQLNFRISTDSAKYIRIQDFDCAKKLKTHSPFKTEGVLKRVNIR